MRWADVKAVPFGRSNPKYWTNAVILINMERDGAPPFRQFCLESQVFGRLEKNQ